MSKADSSWKDVPEESFSQWLNIFNASREGFNVSAPCPICEEKTLHRYYRMDDGEERIIQGNRFIGSGDLWEWCGSCRTFAMYSAAIPEWWTCDLSVDQSSLTLNPEPIEEAFRKRKAMDQHL